MESKIQSIHGEVHFAKYRQVCTVDSSPDWMDKSQGRTYSSKYLWLSASRVIQCYIELARIQASFSWQREHCAMESPSQSRFLRKEIEIRLRAVGNSSLTKHILHTCIENRNKRRRDIEFGELSSVEQNQKIWARRALWSWWVSISCCTVQKHSKSEQRKTPGPLRAQCALCRGGG